MKHMMTTLVDVMVERDPRNGEIVGAVLASPYSTGRGAPGNLRALAFDRGFNRRQVARISRRRPIGSLVFLLGFSSACACLTLTAGLLIGALFPASF